jgi:hypothetical protein
MDGKRYGSRTVSDEQIISFLVGDGFDGATAAYEVANYRSRGFESLTDTPRNAIRRAVLFHGNAA